jgi:hypothetical protein
MKFDFKETIWGRIEVPKEHEQRVLEAIKSREIETTGDLLNFLPECQGDCRFEYLEDTAEPVSLVMNDGFATIEVLDDEGVTVYENSELPK